VTVRKDELTVGFRRSEPQIRVVYLQSLGATGRAGMSGRRVTPRSQPCRPRIYPSATFVEARKHVRAFPAADLCVHVAGRGTDVTVLGPAHEAPRDFVNLIPAANQ
jgi:hypothetical protein